MARIGLGKGFFHVAALALCFFESVAVCVNDLCSLTEALVVLSHQALCALISGLEGAYNFIAAQGFNADIGNDLIGGAFGLFYGAQL